MKPFSIRALDPTGALDGDVPTYDAATGVVTWATPASGGGGPIVGGGYADVSRVAHHAGTTAAIAWTPNIAAQVGDKALLVYHGTNVGAGDPPSMVGWTRIAYSPESSGYYGSVTKVYEKVVTADDLTAQNLGTMPNSGGANSWVVAYFRGLGDWVNAIESGNVRNNVVTLPAVSATDAISTVDMLAFGGTSLTNQVVDFPDPYDDASRSSYVGGGAVSLTNLALATATDSDGNTVTVNNVDWVIFKLTFMRAPAEEPLGLQHLADVDVTTTPPTVGQVLAWNGSKWVPTTL